MRKELDDSRYWYFFNRRQKLQFMISRTRRRIFLAIRDRGSNAGE